MLCASNALNTNLYFCLVLNSCLFRSLTFYNDDTHRLFYSLFIFFLLLFFRQLIIPKWELLVHICLAWLVNTIDTWTAIKKNIYTYEKRTNAKWRNVFGHRHSYRKLIYIQSNNVRMGLVHCVHWMPTTSRARAKCVRQFILMKYAKMKMQLA